MPQAAVDTATSPVIRGLGDGRKDAGAVSSANGAGSVSGQHAFRKPGIHMVTLTVTDNKGRSTTVKHGVTI